MQQAKEKSSPVFVIFSTIPVDKNPTSVYIEYIQYTKTLKRAFSKVFLRKGKSLKVPFKLFIRAVSQAWLAIFRGVSMDIIISNISGVPLYEQIEEQIKSQIMTGELSEGDALPSMRVLAKELKISIITTKRAYEDLERDGFIYSVTGKGSFVKGINSDIIKENMMFAVQELLESAVDKAALGRITLDELQEMLTLLYREKNL